MLRSIKAEFRKLLSVRSTYILVILTFLFNAFMAFYLEGVWGETGSAAGTLQPSALKEVVGNSVGFAALFISIIAILQAGHEYRHNTIMYTLTAIPRRTKVFLSKVLVLGLFGIVVGLATAVFAIGAYKFGLSLRDAVLPAQDFDFLASMGKVAVYSFVYAMFGFLIATLVRNLTGAIVIILMLPMAIEPLLGLLLRDNAVYLPISTFDHIMGVAVRQGDMTSAAAIVLSSVYIGVTGIITWLLFLRRDAN